MTLKREIVFLTHYNDMNGANQSLYTLLERLRASYNIKVFIHNPGQIDEGLFAKLKNLSHVSVENVKLLSYLYFKNKYIGFFKLPLNFLTSFNGMRKIIRYCKDKKVELIYSNSSVESYGFLLSKYLGIRHIWHIREFGFLDYSLRHIGGTSFKRALLKRSDLVIAISRAIEVYVNTKNCKLIYNGVVDDSEISLSGRSISVNTPIRIGVVGLIGKAKNQLIAIDVVKRLRNEGHLVYLDIWGGVGDPNYKKELDEFIARNDLNSIVNFKGFENNKAFIYSAMDILIMSSPYEAFGRVTIEAMSRGIVVIGNNSAGTKELIQDNVSGLLYSGIEQLYNKIISLIENREFYSKLSRGSIDQSKNFTIQKYVRSIDQSIKMIIEE